MQLEQQHHISLREFSSADNSKTTIMSTAIAKTINSSECIIFLNSEKSTYKVKEEVDKDRTLSPWIYEEIFFTSVISERKWYEHRPEYLTEGQTYFQ